MEPFPSSTIPDCEFPRLGLEKKPRCIAFKIGNLCNNDQTTRSLRYYFCHLGFEHITPMQYKSMQAAGQIPATLMPDTPQVVQMYSTVSSLYACYPAVVVNETVGAISVDSWCTVGSPACWCALGSPSCWCMYVCTRACLCTVGTPGS